MQGPSKKTDFVPRVTSDNGNVYKMNLFLQIPVFR